jgi:hypothetical protein
MLLLYIYTKADNHFVYADMRKHIHTHGPKYLSRLLSNVTHLLCKNMKCEVLFFAHFKFS